MIQRNGELLYGRFYGFLLPTLVSSAALQIMLLTDNVVVGNMLGSHHLAAFGLAVPLIQTYAALLTLFGVGGTVLVAFHKGRREEEACREIFTSTILLMLLVCAAVSSLFYLNADKLAVWLAKGEGNLSPLLAGFIRPYAAGAISTVGVSTLGFFIRIDAHPRLVFKGLLSAIVSHFAIAPLLVRLTGSLAGIALAIPLSFAVALIFFARYFFSPKRTLKMTGASGPLTRHARAILSAGSPGCVTLSAGVVRTLVLNRLALSIAGAGIMAVFSVIATTVTIIFMLLAGTAQAMMPVAGVLYGERDYKGIRLIFGRGLRVIMAIAAVIALLLEIFPGAVLRLFGIDAPEQLAAGATFIRVAAPSLLFMAFVTLIRYYSQAVKRAIFPIVLSILEFIVFLLPASWLLSRPFGVNGIWLAYSVSYILTSGVVFAVAAYRSRMSGGQSTGLLMLPPDDKSSRAFDVTIRCDEGEAVALSETLMNFASSQGLEQKLAYRLALSAEEMTVNIIQHGRRASGPGYIDVSLAVDSESATLTIRDDGPPFNPTLFTDFAGQETPEPDEPKIHGLELIRAVCEKMEYSQPLGFNNTVIVIKRPHTPV